MQDTDEDEGLDLDYHALPADIRVVIDKYPNADDLEQVEACAAEIGTLGYYVDVQFGEIVEIKRKERTE